MYTIRLSNFEGPLDLLLFFIKRDELNIYDIPIARITKDFLDYTRLIQLFDLELAGEFLVMASTLIQIKTLMLLPRESVNLEIGEEEDPRAMLIERLLRYKQFKDVASDLSLRADEQKYFYYRQFFEGEQQHLNFNDSLKNATLFDLLRALKRAIDKAPKPELQHIVTRQSITIEDKIQHIFTRLNKRNNILFQNLILHLPKIHIVITFLAILDLVKSRKIRIQQNHEGDDILITKRDDEQTDYENSDVDDSF